MKKIRTAIIPVAGRGTRLMPLTRTTPKELLPVYDRPVIDLIVQEAIDAGIENVILIISTEKESIRNHFIENSQVSFVYQNEPKGDGHAIAQAIPELNKDESVLVLFGDELIDNAGGKNAAKQLIEAYEKNQAPIIGLQNVPRAQVSKYGIVQLNAQEEVETIQEKPIIEAAFSTLAVIGKYVLTPEVLNLLHETEAHSDGEIRLSGTFQKMLSESQKLSACVIEGERFDTGSFDGLLAAGNHYSNYKVQTTKYK
jgi:UTP--glucose-1-phosphate uridylyltransferase